MEEPVKPARRRLRAVLRLAVEFVVVLALVLAVERFLTRDAVRGLAPPIAATLTDGSAFQSRQLAGRPSLIYFWASWCPVCTASQGTISAVAADHAVLTVAMQSGAAAEVAQYMAAEGLSWPTVADADGRLARRFGVAGVPAAFILDGDGRVRFVARGYTTGLGLRARLWLAGF
jgi:thiol-disulfide isomerase/thioredoxin